MCLQSHLFFTTLEHSLITLMPSGRVLAHFSIHSIHSIHNFLTLPSAVTAVIQAVSCHTAVCSSPRASRTLFLPLALEAMLTVSLLRGFFKLDLKGLFMLAEKNEKVIIIIE